jgi:outer membrane immunogenic protein
LKTHYLVTVGPRIGYAFCKWFPYVTGGLAIGDIDLNQNLDGEFQSGHTNPVKAGWMVGAGVQYAITSHWSTRLQYEFIDLGTASCTSSFLSQYPDYTANHSASLHEHNISVAIIYGF